MAGGISNFDTDNRQLNRTSNIGNYDNYRDIGNQHTASMGVLNVYQEFLYYCSIYLSDL